ncbi:MAG: hypothetical protein KDB21_17505, partial [Acidimicrobiales bacterium]|nr:hypothetical protein [Acidimicrobiales bacterium]
MDTHTFAQNPPRDELIAAIGRLADLASADRIVVAPLPGSPAGLEWLLHQWHAPGMGQMEGALEPLAADPGRGVPAGLVIVEHAADLPPVVGFRYRDADQSEVGPVAVGVLQHAGVVGVLIVERHTGRPFEPPAIDALNRCHTYVNGLIERALGPVATVATEPPPTAPAHADALQFGAPPVGAPAQLAPPSPPPPPP